MTRLVLASGSPRRAELLRLLGVDFEVEAPEVDERRYPAEEPRTYVERLARAKAAAVASPDTVSIAGDTVVVHQSQVLGKPAHPAEARSMLARLSGEAHEVVSGVAVAVVRSGRLELESEVAHAKVRFAALTPEEIHAYVASGEPMDKAGAYAVQGLGALLVESIEGHPTTVVGFPLPAVHRLLARAGVQVLA